jgi:hypothetical protein
MSDKIIELHKTNLPDLAKEARQVELLRVLKDLQTNGGKNYAIYEDPDFTPDTGIAILPAPAVSPQGATKICDGKLTLAGVPIKVTAFRLA